jgi:virulence-associated protein VapD
MFHATLFCLATFAAEPAAATGELRPFHAIQSEISDLLKREAQAGKDIAKRAAVVRRMCDLHSELVADERYAESETLQEYRVRLWSRLRRVQTDLKQQLAKTSAKTGEKSVAVNQEQGSDPEAVLAAESLAATLDLLDQSQGGPGYLIAFGGRAGPADHGAELVDLIERTINPAFWDTNGGPGSIYYYAPLRCLVVRATSEMHGRVGGVLGGLRAAGP